MDRADPDPVLDLMKLIKSTTDFSVVFFIFEYVGTDLPGGQLIVQLLLQTADKLRCSINEVLDVRLIQYGIALGMDPVHIVAERLLILQRSHRNGNRKSSLVGRVVDLLQILQHGGLSMGRGKSAA